MEQWTRVEDAPLYQEHLLLGASYTDDEPLLAAPPSYGNVQEELAAFAEGCALCDLSGMTMLLVAGEGVEAFSSAAVAMDALGVGQSGFGAVLSGDGSVCSVPLVSRTGDNEILLCDPSERGLGLEPWLGFLAGIEQNGFKPFDGTSVEDVSTSLVPLLLWGPQARAVLGDYVPSVGALPAQGQVASVTLDRAQCIVCGVSCNEQPCYLLLLPPIVARAFWRSFLSFPVVQPVGLEALKLQAERCLPWMREVLSQERLEPSMSQLVSWGLARAAGGFVGARALA